MRTYCLEFHRHDITQPGFLGRSNQVVQHPFHLFAQLRVSEVRLCSEIGASIPT